MNVSASKRSAISKDEAAIVIETVFAEITDTELANLDPDHMEQRACCGYRLKQSKHKRNPQPGR